MSPRHRASRPRLAPRNVDAGLVFLAAGFVAVASWAITVIVIGPNV